MLSNNENQKSGMLVFGTRFETRTFLNEIWMLFTSVWLYQTSSSRQPKVGDCFAWQLIEAWTRYCKTKWRATMCYIGPGFWTASLERSYEHCKWTFGFRKWIGISWFEWLIECKEGLLLMDIPDAKERCCLSQLRLFTVCIGNSFTTYFGPEGLSSGNKYFKITKNSYWVMSGFYINDISFVQWK